MRVRYLLFVFVVFSCEIQEKGVEIDFIPFNYFSSPLFKCWASGYLDYIKGENLSIDWTIPEKTLGKASDSVYDIVSLGEGGRITLSFNKTIYNGKGYDFAVFENSFNGRFLELAFIEVSSNGVDFVRFDTETLWDTTVDSYGMMDSSRLKGFAGLHKVGYGTPFDLDELKEKENVINGKIDLNNIRFIRVVDIIGDGRERDSKNNLIYDPYPTNGSSGFDLDAIGVYNCR
ncbi:MAG TPA: PEP-CTERM sorting domain-containing protein [Spirochaetota bacterium]|nr:PEP-CTERM sorting domain-containing protein [Spirochaetota bacterium]HOL56798.1 PEP-CTERM sorting domain-containing protein [Spirochaetota bacterium]HPP04265.1 PEP-CTERM sorting domain-containing protein [Spirochaetota bacterium]